MTWLPVLFSPNKTVEIVEKVGEVGPKNVRKNIRVEELFLEMFLVVSRCRKSLVMSAPKPENL